MPDTLLAKERIIAGPQFNRWLVPPAALAIHLCIGMAYGFSVFWKPLGQALVDQDGKPLMSCAAGAVEIGAKLAAIGRALVATDCNWSQFDLGWMYTLFFVFLGCSAAIWGGWLERAGPRKAGVVSALCWCGGLLLSAYGIKLHQLWLMWLGSGVIGGVGLGIGYISPVSTLIKWFPDRRGMATGLAIMGFGGGAMIGSPLATHLMALFAHAGEPGVWQTFIVMALLYAVFMLGGAFSYRLPATGWQPAGWIPAPQAATSPIAQRHVHLRQAHRTPQFWLLWLVLCMNVSAGIGIIGAASPMLQETFAGALVNDSTLTFDALKADPARFTSIVAIGAGFVGLISLFNIGGRLAWASASDRLGRKLTFACLFLLGIVAYTLAAIAAEAQSLVLFVGCFCVIASLYGGGFATIPAYLADLFGTQFVGAIHGRLLTAWSTAGILGPVVVNYLHDVRLESGVPHAALYGSVFHVLSGLLVVGLLANLLVRPVAARHFMSDEELAREKQLAHERSIAEVAAAHHAPARATPTGLVWLAWLAVGLPLAIGVGLTLQKSAMLFQ